MKYSRIYRIVDPFNRFMQLEYAGGIVLLVAVVVAIVWVNIVGIDRYHHFWETSFRVGLGNWMLEKPLHVWINDGLMAVFFFLIGLELKREFMAGELSSAQKASLPALAALGGMLVPAFIYAAINQGTASIKGWGIPMATDIAFALGLLSLVGKRIPVSIKVFLAALAVADDLGAVMVIAFFYTEHIYFNMLGLAGILLLLLWLGNRLGVRHVLFYLLIGLVIWVAFLFSGIHATIAGVLIAFTIPARTKIDEQIYLQELQEYTAQLKAAPRCPSSLTTPAQQQIIHQIKISSQAAETPLQQIEHQLHPWVAFGIMPLFALANAGILVDASFLPALLSPVGLGVLMGLVIGKFVGVLLFTWLAIRLNISRMPQNAGWAHIIGVSLLAGVGFTMSLFISGLAFNEMVFTEQAKAGILSASVIAGLAGVWVLRRIAKPQQ